MAQDQSGGAGGVTIGPPLCEFVDEAHEVTDEERNRPQYGRPPRKPAPPPGPGTDTPPADPAS